MRSVGCMKRRSTRTCSICSKDGCRDAGCDGSGDAASEDGGSFWKVTLRRNDAALEAYREVLIDDARSSIAREGLERMLDDDNLRLRAAEVLEPSTLHGDLRALGDWASCLRRTWPMCRRIVRLRKVAELQLRSATAWCAQTLARAVQLAIRRAELPGCSISSDALTH